MTNHISVGDKVTTDFYPKDRAVVRTVTYIHDDPVSQSGVMITTVDHNRRELSCDAAWYQKVQ